MSKKVNKDESTIANEEAMLASIWNHKFKTAMVHKADYTKRWQTYYNAYNGDYFANKNLPEYRSDMVSNYIFAVVETIRPIMLDNDPKFQSLARQPEGMEYSNDLQEALSYEWDRENVNEKMYRELINTLVIGTCVFFVPWNSGEKDVNAVAVNPYNLFPDPLATTIDNAEYLIYAKYTNVELLKRWFPDKADKLFGGNVKHSELVYDNDKNTNLDNQVLVLEIHTKDYEIEEYYTEKYKSTKPKYPNGRIITICPELGIVLSDKASPYQDGKFPFVLIKDYDVPGKFWGEGEVAQLISPQKYINELNNSIIDNAKATANMPWIVDKNAGIPKGMLTARPGLVIRKNPGSTVERPTPPSMPMYVPNTVETIKSDIEMVSGVHNTVRGENSSGVYTAQGILALQEAGQVRIRLKVKLLENSLGAIAQMWVSRMKQFWKEDKWIRISKIDGSYDLKKFTSEVLIHDYDVKITAGSTMPVNRGAMLDLMIRLAQTQMPDGQPLVDREAVVQYLPEEIKSSLMERMSENQSSLTAITQAIQEAQQAVEELGQGLQQVAEEGQANDDEHFKLIEELMSSVEQLNEEILQLSGEYDNMVNEGKEKEQKAKMQEEFYNKGFLDAEKLYQSPEEEAMTSGGIPDELLGGLEGMSDEELSSILDSNPNLMDMLK